MYCEEIDDFKIINIKCENFSITEKKSSKVWNTSKYYGHPYDDRVVFQILGRRHGTSPENIDIQVLKMGSLNPNRADITIKIIYPGGKQNELKKTVMDWDDYTESFTFYNEVYPNGSVIHCIIRQHEYNDFRANDEKILFASMQVNHMSNYLFSSELSDMIIKIKDEELPAHKIVLACHSPIFKKMFNADMKEAKENCISFEELDANIIKEMIKFMYTGNIVANSDMEVLFRLLCFADMYQIDKLTTFCEYQLIRILTIYNVIEIAVRADCHDVPNLKERIMDFLDFHKRQISYIDAINRVHDSAVLKKFFSKELKMKK